MIEDRYRKMTDEELIEAALSFRKPTPAVRILYAVAKRLEQRQQAEAPTGHPGRCRTIEEVDDRRGLSPEARAYIRHRDGVFSPSRIQTPRVRMTQGGAA